MPSNFNFKLYPKVYHTFGHTRKAILPFKDKRRPPGEPQGNSKNAISLDSSRRQKWKVVQATFRHAEHNPTPPRYVLNMIFVLLKSHPLNKWRSLYYVGKICTKRSTLPMNLEHKILRDMFTLSCSFQKSFMLLWPKTLAKTAKNKTIEEK